MDNDCLLDLKRNYLRARNVYAEMTTDAWGGVVPTSGLFSTLWVFSPWPWLPFAPPIPAMSAADILQYTSSATLTLPVTLALGEVIAKRKCQALATADMRNYEVQQLASRLSQLTPHDASEGLKYRVQVLGQKHNKRPEWHRYLEFWLWRTQSRLQGQYMPQETDRYKIRDVKSKPTFLRTIWGTSAWSSFKTNLLSPVIPELIELVQTVGTVLMRSYEDLLLPAFQTMRARHEWLDAPIEPMSESGSQHEE